MKGLYLGFSLALFVLCVPVIGCKPPAEEPPLPPVIVEPPIPEVPDPSDNGNVVSAKLIAAHNSVRRRKGVDTLRVSPLLMAAAQKHADWMAENHTTSHIGRDGLGFVERVRAEGYSLRLGGESLAAGYEDVAEVMAAWTEKPIHTRNVLEPLYKQIGVGVAESDRGRTYWCAVFASPAGVSAKILDVEIPVHLPDAVEGDTLP